MADEEKKEGNLPDPVMDVLKDLQEKVASIQKPAEEKPVVSVPDSNAQREADRKALGFTEDQMAAHERSQMRVNAPVMERTAWATLEKKSDLDTYRKEIEAELAIYPQERRTPDIMEKIYYMVRGKHADSKPAGDPKKAPKVEGSRVTGGPGYTGADPSMSGGGRGEGAGSDDGELDEAEKFVADKLGVDHKEYAASKKAGKEIRTLRPQDQRPVTSLADIELRRMTARR